MYVTLPPCTKSFHLINLWFPSTCLYTKCKEKQHSYIKQRTTYNEWSIAQLTYTTWTGSLQCFASGASKQNEPSKEKVWYNPTVDHWYINITIGRSWLHKCYHHSCWRASETLYNLSSYWLVARPAYFSPSTCEKKAGHEMKYWLWHPELHHQTMQLKVNCQLKMQPIYT